MNTSITQGAQTPRTVIVLRKEQYGKPVYYPVCNNAHTLARIAKTSTLTVQTLRDAVALGFTVQTTYEPEPALFS